MNHSAIKRTASFMLALLFLCLTLLSAASCASGEVTARATEITSATLGKSGDSVKISATLSEDDASRYKSATLCLFGLEPFETAEMVESGLLKPIAESRGSEHMSFTVDFTFDGGMRNRLTQRFLLARRDENGVYTVLTNGVYLSNPEVLAANRSSSAPSSLKGLALSINEDVSSMAPAHAVLDLSIENYLYASPVKGDTVTYTYAGETLSLCRDAVEALDEQIAALTAQGCAIYLRPILTTSPDALEALSSIGYTGASAESVAYALNLGNEDGYFYLSGFFSFLASRYSGVSGVIPGHALNEPIYAGTTVDSFTAHVESTLALMRTVYNIFRSVNSDARVYLPVNNLYTTDGATALTESGSRDFIGAFSSHARASGDFDWSIYLSMDIPTEGCETIYTEEGTVNVGDTTEKYILPQTLPLLLEQLSSSELLYNGSTREMIWGLAVTGRGDQENQRLSLLYTYMKALSHNRTRDNGASAVRAVIWETLNDTETQTSGLVASDGSEKPVGRLFSALGRSDLPSVIRLSTAESRLGTRYAEIEQVLLDCGEDITVCSGTATGEEALPKNNASTLLYGNSAVWATRFHVLPGTGVVSSYRQTYNSAPMLLATFESAVGCGVYTDELFGADLKDRQMLALTLTAALPEGMGTTEVKVTLSTEWSGRTLRYEGVGVITDGNWSTMTFDLSDFVDKLNDGSAVTLTVSLAGVDASEEHPLSLYLSRVELFETRGWFKRGGWVLIPVIVVVLAIVGVAIWFFRTYDIRWIPNQEREKAQKSTRKARSHAIFESLRAMLARMRPRSKAHTRIMVKPDAHLGKSDSVKAREKEFDGGEDFSIEEAEELFDGGDPELSVVGEEDVVSFADKTGEPAETEEITEITEITPTEGEREKGSEK
ncbi:MAG: hypothetical protein IKC26_07895 [Clostridia bacterium]|nr:hypothetical protein [Clostridia bacterium]